MNLDIDVIAEEAAQMIVRKYLCVTLGRFDIGSIEAVIKEAFAAHAQQSEYTVNTTIGTDGTMASVSLGGITLMSAAVKAAELFASNLKRGLEVDSHKVKAVTQCLCANCYGVKPTQEAQPVPVALSEGDLTTQLAEDIVGIVCGSFRIDDPNDVPWECAVEKVRAALSHTSAQPAERGEPSEPPEEDEIHLTAEAALAREPKKQYRLAQPSGGAQGDALRDAVIATLPELRSLIAPYANGLSWQLDDGGYYFWEGAAPASSPWADALRAIVIIDKALSQSQKGAAE